MMSSCRLNRLRLTFIDFLRLLLPNNYIVYEPSKVTHPAAISLLDVDIFITACVFP